MMMSEVKNVCCCGALYLVNIAMESIVASILKVKKKPVEYPPGK